MRYSEDAILLSVNPEYAHLLVEGYKKVELRRKFPINVENRKAYIYSTSPDQKIIGEVTISKAVKMDLITLWEIASVEAMISMEDFNEYFKNTSFGYALNVENPIKYEKQLNLKELFPGVKRPPQSFQYITEDSMSLDEKHKFTPSFNETFEDFMYAACGIPISQYDEFYNIHRSIWNHQQHKIKHLLEDQESKQGVNKCN